MGLGVLIIAFALLVVVVLVVSAPLRAARRPAASGSAEGEELEVKREAKYREIRDAELDYRTGKLSREDYEAVDGALRAEAVEILNRLEEPARGSGPGLREQHARVHEEQDREEDRPAV